MKTSSILLGVALTLIVSTPAISQQPKPEIYVAPNAPKDKPVNADSSQAEQLEAAIKPYIEKAKASYPEARARFLSGLPPRNTFFVTARIYDSSKRVEQVFIAVKEIKDGRISGVIANEIHLVSGYREGDAYSLPESDLIDWTISKPDGTEEGNFVGKFLDKKCDLFVDFQANRQAFKVASFGTPLPDDLASLMRVKPAGTGPSESALETFVKREYPTFFQE